MTVWKAPGSILPARAAVVNAGSNNAQPAISGFDTLHTDCYNAVTLQIDRLQ